MTAKEFLLQIRDLDDKIQMIEDEIRRIQHELRGIDEITIRSMWPDGLPHGTGAKDPIGDLIARAYRTGRSPRIRELREEMLDLKIQHSRALADLVEQRTAVIEILQMVENTKRRTLLRRKYIDGASLEEIASELGYTPRHMTRLHNEALAEVDEILKKSQKN